MPALAPSQRRWLLAATILGSSMAFIDGSVVNLALPALQSSLGATVSGVQWVDSFVAGYRAVVGTCAGLALLAAVVALSTIGGRRETMTS